MGAIKQAAVNMMVRKAVKDPDKTFPQLLDWAEKLDRNHVNQRTYDNLHTVLDDPENNWNIFLHNIFKQVAPDILEKLASSLVLNVAMESYNKRMESIQKYDCNIPWAILMVSLPQSSPL